MEEGGQAVSRSPESETLAMTSVSLTCEGWNKLANTRKYLTISNRGYFQPNADFDPSTRLWNIVS